MTGAIVLLALGIAAHALAAAAPVHHALDVRLDPEARTLEGTDRVSLHAAGSVAFKLEPGFTIDHLVVDDRPAEVRARGGRITLGEGSEHTVVIEYRGRLAPLPQADVVTGPVAGTEGSYLPAGWYPTFGGLFEYEVTIDVPDPQRALAPGRLTAETTDRGRYRATFTGVAPVEELPLFAGPYRVSERIHRGWRLRTYFHAADADLADTYLERTAGYLDLYDGWIGVYPYSGFSVVSSPLPVGLAFPGIAYLGTQVLRLPFIPDTSLGHEVLHSWWGNGVRVGSGGNWAEGLTTFMADYLFVERQGEDAARAQRLAWLREWSLLPPREDRPLTAFTAREHTASQVTGYHKAAFVFIMLRDEIGGGAFTSGVRRLWQTHRLGTASWSDLEAAFAGAANAPLGRFFEQWVQRAGAPQLSLDGATAGTSHVSFKLEQQPPPYALAVPVTVQTASTPSTRTIRLDAVKQEYAFDLASTPRTLAVDPELRVFRRLARGEIPPIIREVAFDPSAVAAVAAGDEAARQAAREVASKLLEHDPTVVDASKPPLPSGPTVLVGMTAEVTAVLTGAGLEVPTNLTGGTGRAWAARRPDGGALVVIAADGVDALHALAGPLPHYGAQSFVVFDGSRALDRGLWPPPEHPLVVDLAPAPTGSPR